MRKCSRRAAIRAGSRCSARAPSRSYGAGRREAARNPPSSVCDREGTEHAPRNAGAEPEGREPARVPRSSSSDAGPGEEGLRGPLPGEGREGEHVRPEGREARDHQVETRILRGGDRHADRGVLMGKNLRSQRRGRGTSPTYRSPSHRHPGPVVHPHLRGTGIVTDIFQAPGHTAPLARVRFDGQEVLMIACDGLSVGQPVTYGMANLDRGNTMALRDIPEGTLVYNLEAMPGDGGRFVRAAGAQAVVVSQGERTVVQLPSGQFRTFHPDCRATIGAVAGAGRGDKPFARAGKKWFSFRSFSKAYFVVRGVAMNPVDHPHGGGSHQHVGKPSTVGFDAPPGRKVGRMSPQPKRLKEKRRRRQ